MTIFPKLFFLILLAIGSASSFHFIEECVPKDSWEVNVEGTQIDIRFFAPPGENDHTLEMILLDSAGIISRETLLHQTYIISYTAKATYKNETGESYGKRELKGWRNFQLTIDKRFQVFDSDLQKMILDTDEDSTPIRLIVKGTQVTLNCRLSETMHKVADSEVFIPISEQQEKFALFSRHKFTPEIVIGNKIFTLGWNDDEQAITASQSPSINTKPLSAHILYEFTLQSSYEAAEICYSVLTKNVTAIGPICLENIVYISYKAKGQKTYIVKHSTGTVWEETAVDTPKEDVTIETDTLSQEGKLIILVLSCCIALLFMNILILLCVIVVIILVFVVIFVIFY